MSRHPKPRCILALTLLALTFLLPALAAAQPHPREAVSAATTRQGASPSLLAQLRSFLSVLWQNGSGLEPNGRPGPTTTSDNGSILDPDGRH